MAGRYFMLRSDARFVQLLAATVIGLYFLIVAGATTAVTDAAMACPTWPACHGQWVVPLNDVPLAVAWGHRVIAAVVGVFVALTGVVAWLRDESRRVKLALALALVLYPLQVGLGALVATTGVPAFASAVHLVVAMAIFTALVLALAWQLELTYPGASDREPQPELNPAQETADEPAVASTSTAYAYFQLMKPRLMWLLCLVASAAMTLAAGPALEVGTVVATLFAGVLAIGASGTFNHVLERDIDKQMSRTADRPLATAQIPIRNALVFGGVLTVASLTVFSTVNAVAAVLGLVAILFYSVIYTLVLKPNTVQNTVLGGLAGALPALIGWAAVTGEIGLPALVLAGVIFLWTPAHFYNLALAYKADYERGGFPMMPVVHGEAVTRKHILFYLAATLLAASVLGAYDVLGWLYAATTVLFGGVFLWAAVRLHRERTHEAAFRTFHASNAYLGCLLLAIIIDTLAL